MYHGNYFDLILNYKSLKEQQLNVNKCILHHRNKIYNNEKILNIQCLLGIHRL